MDWGIVEGMVCMPAPATKLQGFTTPPIEYPFPFELFLSELSPERAPERQLKFTGNKAFLVLPKNPSRIVYSTHDCLVFGN